MEQQYTIDANAIMHDLIDNEVVIVNLDNGYYYNSIGTGAQVWHLLALGHSVQAIIRQLQSSYAEIPQIAEEVHAFVAELDSEALIQAATSPFAETPTELTAIPYTTPTIQKFTDMDQLLMLDPIHEVEEEAGWPQQA